MCCCTMLNPIHDCVSSCLSEASQAYTRCTDTIETVRRRIVLTAYRNCPLALATIIDRISRAIPDVFVVLGSCVGGVALVPAGVLLLGLNLLLCSPLVNNVLQWDFSRDALIRAGKEIEENIEQRIDGRLLPAFCVAMAVDLVFSSVVGVLTGNAERLFHAAAVAAPGTLITLLLLSRPLYRGL